jgi:hypothetical protein
LKDNTLKPRIFYAAKESFIIGDIKTFQYKQKLKQYVTTKLTLQKTLKGILYTEDEEEHSYERLGTIKSQKISRQANVT